MSEKLPVSSQWVITYYKAVSKAWSDGEFQSELLKSANKMLEEQFGFVVPKNIEVQFQKLDNNDFSDFPIKNIGMFDESQAENVLFKVPIPPKPEDIKNSLDYLCSFTNLSDVNCCSFCC